MHILQTKNGSTENSAVRARVLFIYARGEDEYKLTLTAFGKE